MSYLPLPLNGGVPNKVARLVTERIEPILRDVSLMLQFPKVQGEPGFNLTATPALFGVIAGMSSVFAQGRDSPAFKEVARMYPLDEEPPGATVVRAPDAFAKELYETYRCSLVHNLGFTTKWSDPLNCREIEPTPKRMKVVRHDPLPLSAQQLADLESTPRPNWLGATMTDDGVTVRLNLDALYWGVRRLVVSVAEDSTRYARALQFLQAWANPNTLTPAAHPVMSSSPYQVETFSVGNLSVDASVGAVAAGQLNLASKK